MSVNKEFMDLLKSSTIVQGLIALTITLTICVMYIEGQIVPNELIAILTLILGFYFGTKSQANLQKGK